MNHAQQLKLPDKPLPAGLHRLSSIVIQLTLLHLRTDHFAGEGMACPAWSEVSHMDGVNNNCMEALI